jgi:protein-disulfide isomerase
MPRPLYIILLVVASFALGYFVAKIEDLGAIRRAYQAAARQQAPVETSPEILTVDVGTGHLPALGAADARVTIIEYADFKCPFCAYFFQDTLPEIKRQYIDTGKARLYFRHFAFLGPESIQAAQAAECANEAGKFWAYHDLLFAQQGGNDRRPFTRENLVGFAEGIGIDAGPFADCLQSERYREIVEQDLNDGDAAGIDGTPAIIVNGRMIVGAEPFPVWQMVIEEALNK